MALLLIRRTALMIAVMIAIVIAILSPAVVAGGTSSTYGPGDGFVIPDNNPGGASSSIVITDSGAIEDLDLVLSEMNHTWLGDLIITLTHVDSGTAWNITNRAGQLEGGDEEFGFDIDLGGTYTIDDESTSGSFHDQIGFEGGLLPPGDYNSLGSLSNFDGLDIAGTWTLLISDNAGGDTGELGSWSLLAETANDASSGLVFTLEEIGGDVIGTLSGSLDLDNAVLGNSTGISAIGARINPPSPFISTGSNGTNVDSYLLSSAPVFGPGEASFETLTFASMFTGDIFSLTTDFVGGDPAFVPSALLPDGYVSGTALSASMLFAGATFESLGITPGIYIYPLLQETSDGLSPAGSSPCAEDSAPGKTIMVIAGDFGVLPLQDCIFTSRFEPEPDIVRFDKLNFVPNEDITGGSVRWIDGATCDCFTSDYDFNIFYDNDTNLRYFWPRTEGIGGGVTLDGSTYALLSSGDVVGPQLDFIAADGLGVAQAWSTPGDVTGYLGFRFEDQGQLKYGYALISTGPDGRPATIISYAFDNNGGPITIP